MIKRLDSKYVPDERKNAWVKLKPEYLDGVGDELDLLILGGFYGSGERRRGNVSHFLLGVRKGDTCALFDSYLYHFLFLPILSFRCLLSTSKDVIGSGLAHASEAATVTTI